MELGYFFFYTEANIVCILILALLLINDRLYGTKQEKQIWFNRTIIAHILYFVSDIFWAAVLSGQLPRYRSLVVLFNLNNFILMNLLAYAWFMYMAAAGELPLRNSRRQKMLCALPVVLSAAVMAVAYIMAPYFWISEEGELNIWYYPMMIAVPVLYLLAAFAISMVNARKADSRDKRNLYRLIGIYPLAVLGFGLVQTFALNAPLFCFGCTLMMLFFYIQSMETLISVDSLTRLNNRGQINRYMEQARYRENAPAWAMMIDIDRFKRINDTYGHAEGDRALKLMAEALKQACEHVSCPVFLGRYGGDEFAVFIQNPGEGEAPGDFAETVGGLLRKKQQENRLPYDLNVSVGYDVLRDNDDTMEACLARADEKLYEYKRSKGTLRDMR